MLQKGIQSSLFATDVEFSGTGTLGGRRGQAWFPSAGHKEPHLGSESPNWTESGDDIGGFRSPGPSAGKPTLDTAAPASRPAERGRPPLSIRSSRQERGRRRAASNKGAAARTVKREQSNLQRQAVRVGSRDSEGALPSASAAG